MRALLFASLLLGGCYDPKPPGGSYQCGADDACPSGLSCECGLCVSDPSQAACSFSIALASGDSAVTVAEHQKFDVVVQALGKDGKPATAFSGDVTLSSTWGDVCVGTSGCIGLPDVVHMSGGTASATVQLNRETNAPQSAILRATFGANVGSSGLAKIIVQAPPTVRDAAPISGSIATSSYGFAKYAVGSPYVLKDATGWKLYFVGGEKQGQGMDAIVTTAVGVATSSDGLTWLPPAASLFSPQLDSLGKVDPTTQFGSVSAYVNAAGVSLFFGRSSTTMKYGFELIQRADAASAAGPFSELALPPTLQLSDCVGYQGIDQPSVIADPEPALSGGGPDSAVMFFSAQQPVAVEGNSVTGLAVLRAVALDGQKFAVDPSPALESINGERSVVAPRILVDGKTYKMWYSFAQDVHNVRGSVSATATDQINPCNTIQHWTVGYATSSDGYFWVRSDTNPTTPALGTSTTGFDQNASLLLGSVYPADGVDPSNGIALFYSPMRTMVSGCLPDGMGRAVRP